MYTNLEHSAILRAVEFLLGQFSRRRYQSLSVTKHGKNGVRFGRCYNFSTHLTVSLSSLAEIVSYDLGHLYFTLGDVLLQQIIGIGMGSNIGPALALITTAYTEYQWIKSIYWRFPTILFKSARYVDDTLALAGL